ncbi:iron-sulfur cluster co-chaperone protein HscB, mitochondrial isoform X1 [Arapaima gigas]
MHALNKLALRCVSRGIRTEKCSSRGFRGAAAAPTFGGERLVELRRSAWPLHSDHLTDIRLVARTFCGVPARLRCWQCGTPLRDSPVFFCRGCGVIQRPDERATYFDIMGCEKSFAMDTQKLQSRYLELQRSLHPDNFSQKTQKEQEYSETQSALVNKAYRTLLKPLSRGVYMLNLVGVHLEEGTDGVDSQFLLEIMDLNEQLAKTQSREESRAILHSVTGSVTVNSFYFVTAFLSGDLQSAKFHLVKMKYFENIEKKIKEKLSELLG